MNKCKSYFGDYKCHVATSLKDSEGRTIYVDKCLKEAVENLNAQGFKTVASCCGHGIIQPMITIELTKKYKIMNKKLTCTKCGAIKEMHCHLVYSQGDLVCLDCKKENLESDKRAYDRDVTYYRMKNNDSHVIKCGCGGNMRKTVDGLVCDICG